MHRKVECSDGSTKPTLGSAYETAAQALCSAFATGTTVPAPRFLVPERGLASGYCIQARNVWHWQSIGKQVVGYKIGMTSTAIQNQFGIDHPTRGMLLDSMLYATGTHLSFPAACAQGRAEGEIAFVLREDLSTICAIGDMTDAIDYAIPAIEIVNSRVAQWDVTAFDFVADNAAAQFVILGDERIDCRTADFKTLAMRLTVNSETRSVGVGADCLGSPLHSLHWLAHHLIENDNFLRKGDIVMSGSLGPAVRVGAGDRVDMYLDHGAAVTVYFH